MNDRVEAGTAEADHRLHPGMADNYLTHGRGFRSWILTLDHKRIGLLYLFAISFFFALGGIYAALIRLELVTPEGDLLTPEMYNRVFTMHGVTMIFFFLIPSIPAVLFPWFSWVTRRTASRRAASDFISSFCNFWTALALPRMRAR